MHTLIIDNYDSFTYNIYQLIATVNSVEPTVVKNDEVQWDDVDLACFDNIVVSPGPGTPECDSDMGISREAIRYSHLPLLGVCLGCQGLGVEYGGQVVNADQVMHGRISKVHHTGDGLFKNIPSPFSVVRYHSLMVRPKLPSSLLCTAWTDDGTVMGLMHRSKPFYGVQFHPESISSQFGQKIFENFRQLTLEHSVAIC
ncbi:anthranilate synthase component II [Saccharospirillum salsuginis]|uniref:Glutamine amidotransferase n=1 Tax=Saccharospirillum salsuginis TaxID=418750 RepID=A0A918NCD3_9GAMM|nr:aminodeoxychorismate/anthranilate synthase component II [Saccharospirillum salsuginis]GGX57478.1 glutamine amidotransferase [Saccharospirillum salsuginis]